MNSISEQVVYGRLTEIFHEVFDNDDIVLDAEMTAEVLDEWDSLNHIRLIVATEKEFEIRFSTAEIVRLENVGQFVRLIMEKASG